MIEIKGFLYNNNNILKNDNILLLINKLCVKVELIINR